MLYSANRACALLYAFLNKYKSKKKYLIPVNVCPDVPLTFCLVKQPFELVDINSETLCIDEKKCMALLQENPKEYEGILFIRTYGFIYNADVFFKTIKSISKDFKIIDDRCLCLPDFDLHNAYVDLCLFSTGHCKQIDLGTGGYALSKDSLCLTRMDSLEYMGTDEVLLYKKAFSQNVALRQIPQGWLDVSITEGLPPKLRLQIKEEKQKRIEIRNRLNNIYKKNLINEIQLKDSYNDWRFNIVVDSQIFPKILDELFNKGLFASKHYRSCNVLFGIKGDFSVSDSFFSTVINLFNDKYYSEEKAFKTCEIINKVVQYGNYI